MAISQLSQLTAQISARIDAGQLGTRSNSELIKSFEVGQLLRARVAVDETSQQRFIEIGNTRIKTDRQFPFAPGQLLTIRVDQLGAKPEFRILTPPSLTPSSVSSNQGVATNSVPLNSNSVTNASTQPINQAIRAVIGHQAPTNVLLPVLSQTLNAIAKLPTPTTSSTETISTSSTAKTDKPSLELELKAAAQKVRDSIPLLSQLRQPIQIKQSGLNSGTFFESKLSPSALLSTPGTPATLAALGKDLKPALLQLVALVRQALTRDAKLSPQLTSRLQTQLADIITQTKSSPTQAKSAEAQTRVEIARLLQLQPLQQLLKTGESLLSRIQLNQLSSLVQSSESNQVWYMEIPYAHNNRGSAMQFRISKEGGKDKKDKDDAWQLEFSFELDGYGTVLSDIRLKGKSVNLRFTAETDSGLKLLQNNIHLLDDRLRQLGLSVNTQPTTIGEIGDLLRPHTLNKLLDTHV
jgi:hypothetical protein